MGAVGVLAASEIRRRWKSTVAIALLIGIVGAIALATAAGARRSGSALPRFNAYSRSSDIEISVGRTSEKEVAAFRDAPGVATVSHLRAYALDNTFDSLSIATSIDGRLGNVVDRARLIEGRRAIPSAAEEITIGESLADLLDLEVGSRFKWAGYTPAQVEAAFDGAFDPEPKGPSGEFHVVGIVRRPLDLGVRASAGGVVALSPSFGRTYDDTLGSYTDVLRVKTDRGAADVERVTATARQIWGEDFTFGTQSLGIETEGARSAIDVLTIALWIFAAVTAVAGLVAAGFVLTRDVAHSDLEQETLRALGLTRRQRVGVSGPRVAFMACGGALLAGLGAVALSPLFPLGVARRADPDPGFHADWTVFVFALAAIVAAVAGIALLAALRATRSTSLDRAAHAYRHTSTLIDLAAGTGLRPTATNGLRMALQPGSGDARVPLRSAFFAAVFGVAGVTAALVFAASLSHLVRTPRLYGWTWDAKIQVAVEPGKKPCGDGRDHGLAADPRVDGVARVCTTEMQVDGRPVAVWGFESLHGSIDPEVVAGRAPSGPEEIALGAVTLDALHKDIGDTVRVRSRGAPREYVVVGRVVLPSIGDPQPLADGAAMTGQGWKPLYGDGENETDFLVVRAQPGARADVVQKVRALRSAPEQANNFGVPDVPVEVDRLQQVAQVPAAIAALLGSLGLLAVGYALVTAVRRRRHELAVLKILGFSRGQVRTVVAWQATILGAVGLLLGIPIGFIVGRAAWHLVADGLGVSNIVTAPVIGLVLLIPSALVLVNLIAYFPGRSAAKTLPAVTLRTE